MCRRHLGLIFPPGTYQAPAFFWRGGDEFKEAEKVKFEFSSAKAAQERSRQKLESVKREYEELLDIYSNKDKQVVALASSLGKNSRSTMEGSKLDKKIAELTMQICEVEEKIAEYSEKIQPKNIALLEKERATYYVDVEKLTHDIEIFQRDINVLNNEYIKLMQSNEWRNAFATLEEHQLKAKERFKRRAEVNKCFEDQNYAKRDKKEAVVRVPDDKNNVHIMKIKELTNQKFEMQSLLSKAQHQRFKLINSGRIMISSRIEMISQLNNALEILGHEKIDVEELKQKYMPDFINPPTERPASTVQMRSSQRAKNITKPFS